MKLFRSIMGSTNSQKPLTAKRIQELTPRRSSTGLGGFVDLNNDLGLLVDENKDPGPELLMPYFYARRIAAAGMFSQGAIDLDGYERVETLFFNCMANIGSKITKEEQVRFQEESLDRALELVQCYIVGATRQSTSLLIHCAKQGVSIRDELINSLDIDGDQLRGIVNPLMCYEWVMKPEYCMGFFAAGWWQPSDGFESFQNKIPKYLKSLGVALDLTTPSELSDADTETLISEDGAGGAEDPNEDRFIITSPFEPTADLQSEVSFRNYMLQLSKLGRSDFCVELSNVMAAKHNLMTNPSGLGDYLDKQKLVTDLTDKATVICILEFGQQAVTGYAGGDLRAFNSLLNSIDAEVAQQDLQPDQHGSALLRRLREALEGFKGKHGGPRLIEYVNQVNSSHLGPFANMLEDVKAAARQNDILRTPLLSAAVGYSMELAVAALWVAGGVHHKIIEDTIEGIYLFKADLGPDRELHNEALAQAVELANVYTPGTTVKHIEIIVGMTKDLERFRREGEPVLEASEVLVRAERIAAV